MSIAIIPADNTVFTLSLHDAGSLDMVRTDYQGLGGWRHNGQLLLRGSHTGQFQLIRLGDCYDLMEVLDRIANMRLEEAPGQWREAFKQTFPHPDGKGNIGFADPMWLGPFNESGFPVLIQHPNAWASGYRHARRNQLSDFSASWRWLVKH